MALTSVYYDGPVTETQRAQNRTGAAQYGVYGPEDFKVTAHPSIPNAVIVKAGRAHGHGVTDTADIDQIVNCTPLSVGQIRWDLIVVRRNWQPALGGPSTLVALHAGAGATIPAQRKVGPGVEDDQPLAFIKWQGGTSAPVEFVDVRVHAANGGLFAKSDLVRAYLTGAGTEVNINGVMWALQVGANDVLEWRKVGDYSVADIPWTNLTLSDLFGPAFGSGWSGVKYAVRNGWVTVTGAVARGNSWGNDQRIATLPTGLQPGSQVQGVGVQVRVDGVMVIPAGGVAASFGATWPLF